MSESNAPPMIRVAGLKKRYGDFEAVRGLDFEVQPGEVFGFLGPNGAGKTTTMRMITGLLLPTEGSIHIDGHNLLSNPLSAKAVTGFIPDRPYVYEKLTAFEFLDFVGGLHGLSWKEIAERGGELLETFALGRCADSLIESFSHGMKQRLVFCAALLPRPRLLVVDEPMVGLDPRGAKLVKQVFRDLCKSGELAVFLSTHTLEVAEEVCDRIAILRKGAIVTIGTMDELKAQAEDADSGLESIFLQLTEEARNEPQES